MRVKEKELMELKIKETEIPTITKPRKKYNNIGDIISDKSIYAALETLKEEQQEKYEIWIQTFLTDYDLFNLPEHLKVECMIRKLPLHLRSRAKTERNDIKTVTDMREFLYKAIFGGRNYTFQRNVYREANKMTESDTNFPEVLNRIKLEQVPTLLSLQPKYVNQTEETKECLRNKEILELLNEALTPSTLAICQNKGASESWQELYESCNQIAAAKMTLNKESKDNPKKLSALQMDTEPQQTEGNPKEKILSDEISRLRNVVKQMKTKQTANTAQTTQSSNATTDKPGYRNKWCNFHQSKGHDEAQCRRLKGITEEKRQHNNFLVSPNGKRNYCKFCVPNNIDLKVNLCFHCWKHSDPSKGVPRTQCLACEHIRRIQDRPANPPSSNPPNTDGTI